jgi:hypothetical protein
LPNLYIASTLIMFNSRGHRIQAGATFNAPDVRKIPALSGAGVVNRADVVIGQEAACSVGFFRKAQLGSISRQDGMVMNEIGLTRAKSPGELCDIIIVEQNMAGPATACSALAT